MKDNYIYCKECGKPISFNGGRVYLTSKNIRITQNEGFNSKKLVSVCSGSSKENLCMDCFMKDKPETFKCPVNRKECIQNKDEICVKKKQKDD